MRRPPRNPEQGALERKDLFQMGLIGATIAAISLTLAVLYYRPAEPANLTWQTMIFATLGFSQVFQALALRSSGHSPFAIKTNPLMAVVVVSAVLLQLAAIYLPGLESFFKLGPLSGQDLLISIASGSLVYLVVTMEKKIFSRQP